MRFHPEEDVVALVYFGSEEHPVKKSALLVNESYSGCSLVMVGDIPLELDDQVRVKAGNLEVAQAQVRWIQQLDERIIKIGVAYKDM